MINGPNDADQTLAPNPEPGGPRGEENTVTKAQRVAASAGRGPTQHSSFAPNGRLELSTVPIAFPLLSSQHSPNKRTHLRALQHPRTQPRFTNLESIPRASQNPVEMSRAHDGHRSFFPVGNPFRMIFPRGTYLSPKLSELLASYEDGLAWSLRKLKPEATSEVLTLSWMRLAVDCLSELHTNIATLITELELPMSDWDEKWVDIYLNSSVKLLDICIALSSELARLDQGQLLVQYVLHVLDCGRERDMPSQEQLKRAEVSLKEWMDRARERCPRLDNCLAALQELSGNLCLMKVKHSAKGKVLMRALYGIEAITVFICSVLVAILSGSSKPLVEFAVPEKFGWSKDFDDLHKAISGELSIQLSKGSVAAVKELEEVEACARQLHALTSAVQFEEENASLAHAVSHSKEVVMSDTSTTTQEGTQEDDLKLAEDIGCDREAIMPKSITTDGVMDTAGIKEDAKIISHAKEVMVLEKTSNGGHHDDDTKQATSVGCKTNALERREELLNCISSMSKSTEGLRLGLDSLSKRVGDFFQIVLTGRDALLCNLRISDGAKVAAEVRS
ncbi:hypothetical protein U9M48_009699 [Paspalum notatum var. saurae]|uniref:Uncharacterized protein n=1 Tax=Paspalum notatum var. saurae TaxID=547442 RepID=A0AAQ3WFN9_PASNO